MCVFLLFFTIGNILSIVHHIFQRFHFALCGLLSVLYARNVYRDTHFKYPAVNTGVGYIRWIVQHIGADIGGKYQWLTASVSAVYDVVNVFKGI